MTREESRFNYRKGSSTVKQVEGNAVFQITAPSTDKHNLPGKFFAKARAQPAFKLLLPAFKCDVEQNFPPGREVPEIIYSVSR